MKNLTDKQKEIITLMKEGYTREQLKDKYCISELTLLTKMQEIYPHFENVINFRPKGKFEQLRKYLLASGKSENALKPKHPAESPITIRKLIHPEPPKVDPVDPETGETKLTERENEVMGSLAAGFSYKEIAKSLYISVTTVRTHVNAIFQKLHVHSLQELLCKTFAKNKSEASEPQTVTVEKPAEVEETKPVTEATPQIVEPKATTNHADDLKNRIENELKTIQSRIAECKEIIKIAQIQKEILEKILKE